MYNEILEYFDIFGIIARMINCIEFELVAYFDHNIISFTVGKQYHQFINDNDSDSIHVIYFAETY